MLDCQRCLFSTCCQPTVCVRFFLVSNFMFSPPLRERKNARSLQKLHCFECVCFASTFLVFHRYLSLCPFRLFLLFFLGEIQPFSGPLFNFACNWLFLGACFCCCCRSNAFSLHFFLCVSLFLLAVFIFPKQYFCYVFFFFITGICTIKYSFPVTLYDTWISKNVYAFMGLFCLPKDCAQSCCVFYIRIHIYYMIHSKQ